MIWVAGGVAGLVLAVGLLLSTQFDWRGTIDATAEPETLHRFVSDVRRWPEWLRLEGQRRAAELSFGETTRGEGAELRWEGGGFGSGRLSLTDSDPQRGVRCHVWLAPEQEKPLQGELQYERIGRKTRVSWRFAGDLGGRPIGGYLIKLLRPLVETFLEQGLERLKIVAEAAQRQADETDRADHAEDP